MHTSTIIGAILVLVAGRLSSAGGTWSEVGDAGDIFTPAQLTSGVGAITSITGMTSIAASDRVDAYRITVTDPSAFYAATTPAYGGSASFDTRLFLFTLFGQPLLMNDDFPAGSPFQSLLAGPAFYMGTGEALVDNPQELVAGQEYILAIAGFSEMIETASNQEMFRVDTLFDFDALYGPDPAVPGAPHHWENAFGPTGTYTIALAGATFAVPAPGALSPCVLFGALALRRRR